MMVLLNVLANVVDLEWLQWNILTLWERDVTPTQTGDLITCVLLLRCCGESFEVSIVTPFLVAVSVLGTANTRRYMLDWHVMTKVAEHYDALFLYRHCSNILLSGFLFIFFENNWNFNLFLALLDTYHDRAIYFATWS